MDVNLHQALDRVFPDVCRALVGVQCAVRVTHVGGKFQR
jgi:hypothetical protein